MMRTFSSAVSTPHPRPDLGVLVGEDDVADPPQGSIEVGHDLLAADDEEHATRARGIRAELVPDGRRGDESSVVGDGGDAAEDEVRRGHELADLASLRRPVHREHARPDGVVTPGFDELAEEADLLERLRLAGVDLRALRDQAEDDRARLLARVDDDRLDVV